MDKRVFLFAGAGISAESGVPTFRDSNGLWSTFNVQQFCDQFTFLKNKNNSFYRKNLMEFYTNLKTEIEKTAPNEAHLKAAKWQKELGPSNVQIWTSNIDDLFERAGCESVKHVHGDLSKMECCACGKSWKVASFEDSRCMFCNSRLTKPAVVFFNQKAPLYPSLFSAFHPKKRKKEDVFLFAGCSQEVIAPTRLFKDNKKGTFILVNTREHEEDWFFSKRLYGPATEGFKEIDF